jgi:DNA-binding MurR/RpiR family transcriptional regulator
MSLRNTLAANDRPLTESERQVVDVLLANPEETVFMPAAEVAQRASVHESTVIRLAQKLRYAGYAELREDLRRDVRQMNGAARQGARGSRRHDLRALVQDEADALLRLPQFISQQDMDAAARTLLDARRVYLWGNPFATPLIDILDRRLRRLGLNVVAMRKEGTDLATHLISFDRDDVLLTFALRDAPPGLQRLTKRVHGLGGRTIVLSDVVGLQLRPAPTHLLAAPRGVDESLRTLIVPAVLCYALQLAAFHLDPERATAALERLGDFSRLIGVDPPAETKSQLFQVRERHD